MFGEDAGAGLLLLLLITIACVAAAVHFIRIPYTVALVVAGLALALLPDTPRLTVTPEVILFLFLPILLFSGVYHLNVLSPQRPRSAPHPQTSHLARLAWHRRHRRSGRVGAALCPQDRGAFGIDSEKQNVAMLKTLTDATGRA
jgi:hypothetical protein